jgi:two-component system KDP operon response regulator KdpE
MSQHGTVLVVDDEPSIRRALRGALCSFGFIADEASDGEQGIDLVRHRRYDAIFVDMNMPGKGGIETCREIRRSCPDLGILMLSVRDGEEDKVRALEAGADDYITKPFGMRELTARLRAVRRGRLAGPSAPSFRMTIGEISLEPERHTVTRKGRPLHLTPREFDVLEYLMRNAGAPVRHRELLCAVWGETYGNEVEYLRTLVRQLRKKIEDDPARPYYLTTEASIGYRFAAE